MMSDDGKEDKCRAVDIGSDGWREGLGTLTVKGPGRGERRRERGSNSNSSEQQVFRLLDTS